MSEEIGKIIPLEVLKKLHNITRGEALSEWERHFVYMTGIDIEGQRKTADEHLEKLIEERKASGTL